MKKSIKIFVIATIFALSFFVNLVAPPRVSADSGLCGIFPCGIAQPCLTGDCPNGNALTFVGSILEIVLSLIFVGILIYGIWIIVQAALKIVRSNGNEEEIQSGMKLIKGAYTGLILIFVGLIGLVIVLAFFNATDIFKVGTTLPQGVTLQ